MVKHRITNLRAFTVTHTQYWWGDLLVNIHLEDPEGDGRILFKAILRRNFVRMAQNRVKFWALLLAM
jgi:hypothetical protein